MKNRNNAVINIAPLVDVMLVLLIIFIITAPMLQSGIQIDLPKTKASSVITQNKPIIISIGEKGKIHLQKNAVTLAALKDQLDALTNSNRTSVIQIKADRRLSYERVFEVIHKLVQSGYSRISLVAERQ